MSSTPLSTASVSEAVVPTQRQSGTRATVQTIGSRLVVQLINAFTGIMTARALLPAGRGQLAAIVLWTTLLPSVTTFGVPSSLLYFLRSRPESKRDLISTGITLTALLSVLSSIVAVLLMPHLLHKYPHWAVRDAQWLMIAAPFYSLSYAGRAILEGHEDFKGSNLSQIMNSGGTLIGLFVLLLLHQLHVFSAAICYVGAIVAVCWILFARLPKHMSDPVRPSFKGAKVLLSYGVRSYWIDLLGTLSVQVDQVLVVSLLTPADMGLYVVMLSLSRTANVFQNGVTAVLFPKATGQKPDRIRELTGRAGRVSFVMTACATFSVGVLGPTLLRIFYGKDYTTASTCLRLLLVEVTLSGLVFILAQAFMALDHPGTVSLLQGFGLTLSLPLMLVLIPRFGITGAAIALLLSTTARLCLICAGFPLYLKLRMPDLVPKKQDFSSLVASLKGKRAVTA